MSAARGAIRAVDDVSSACPGGERCRTRKRGKTFCFFCILQPRLADLPEGQAYGT